MSKIIEKRILTKYFNKIVSGEKTFEIRLANWECNDGDTLLLKEVDESGNLTGNTVTKKVGTVVKTKDLDFWSDNDIDRYGYQVISLKDDQK